MAKQDAVHIQKKSDWRVISRQRNNQSNSSGYQTHRPSNKLQDGHVAINRENVTQATSKKPSNPPSHLSGPILKTQEPWQTWPELTVRIANLPPNITTWALWTRFEMEGNVVFIEIFENRQGFKDGKGKIRFQPPPHRAFWNDKVVMRTIDGEGAFQLRVEPEPKKRRFEIQSPIRKTFFYPEQMVIHPIALDFGLLQNEKTMMKMYSVTNTLRDDMSFRVDLLRMRIVINFQVPFTKYGINRGSGRLDRINKYMFSIPFGQLEKIHHIDVNETQWALIFTLDSPPRFFRKRGDAICSHSNEALIWSEFDTWYRQTDIVYDPRCLKTAVLSLNKDVPVIDIGRWTTYRLVFNKSQVEQHLFDNIKNALQDWNIEMCGFDGFNAVQGREASIWNMIDTAKSTEVESDLQFLNDGLCILPFNVRYQLEVCISQGILNEYNIEPAFINKLSDLADVDQNKAVNILKYIAEQETRIYDPMSIFEDSNAVEYFPQAKVPHYCAYTRKATVTPTTIYYGTPTVETSNRVIRQFAKFGDRFLRVQFTDEKFEGRITSCAEKSQNDELFTRVYRTLYNGIRIGDRHYEFLAFGNSQFRENGAYFFCPSDNLSCADIRQWMGTFDHIAVVAKYAARLGLCFSTTRAINGSGVKIEKIKDVERNGYCFTDGVGKISEFLAKMIAAELGLSSTHAPSAFQFRLGGCKGILAVWPDAKGQEVHIRPSQEKFRANYFGLEIIRCSHYSPAALNRQTITILSSLGVPDEIFNNMLTEQLSNYQSAMSDNSLALDLLSRYIDDNHMTITIASMVLNGFMASREPFVMSLLHLWRSWSIKLLKEKAKIIVESGAFLLGCTDETKTLLGYTRSAKGVEGLPQIFLQIPDKKNAGRYVAIKGICILGRNPSLHPGDIRVVQAVDVPALHHLRDVVVFSQLGERDVPSMCSGGDLDGDDFFVIWDQNLIPREWNVEPMNYAAPPAKELDRPVMIEDLMKFFVRYMKNDALPTIAHSHLAQSDYLDMGIKDRKCLELAELHSKAVDYVKSGISAEMPKRLRPRMWPHFMEKNYKPKEQIYISQKILGQLYDKVERVDFVPQYEEPFDKRILNAFTLDNDMLKKARQTKSQYDTAVKRLMAQHEIRTEFEIWSTFVLSKPRVGTDYKVQEEMAIISSALKDRFRRVCIEHAGSKDFKDLGPFVAAMYRVTCEEMSIALHECHTTKLVGGHEVPRRKMEPKYMPLMSFPWLFHEILGRIATGIEANDDIENLGLPFISARNDSRKQYKSGSKDESDSEDFVVTVDGVTHRGEVLDLFRPDNVDSEGDDVEQPEHTSEVVKDTTQPRTTGVEDVISDIELDGFLDTDEVKRPVDNGLIDFDSEDLNLPKSDSLSSSLSDLAGLNGFSSFAEACTLPVELPPLDQEGKRTLDNGYHGDISTSFPAARPQGVGSLVDVSDNFDSSVEHFAPNLFQSNWNFDAELSQIDNFENLSLANSMVFESIDAQNGHSEVQMEDVDEEIVILGDIEESDFDKLARLVGA